MFSVRHISAAKGRGLFATGPIAEGELILRETPLVACQYAWNQVYFPACAHCLRSLETAPAMAQRLANLPEPPTFLPAAMEQGAPDRITNLDDGGVLINAGALADQQRVNRVRCTQCDDEYCSEQCRAEAWTQYHRRLCISRDAAETHPLRLLADLWKQTHYPPETATVFLLVRMIVMIQLHRIEQRRNGSKARDEQQTEHDQQLKSGSSRFAPFDTFCAFYENTDVGTRHKFLADQFKNNVVAIRDAVKAALYTEDDDDLFTEEAFNTLFCLMCLNSQGVGTSCLEQYEIALGEIDTAEANAALDELASLDDAIDEHSGEFTHCEGSALFRQHACLNHSCQPNVEAQFPNNNTEVHIVATRDIAKGDELCLSYLDCVDEMSLEERKSELREYYLFECDCPRCRSEEAAASASKSKKKSGAPSRKKK